MLQVIGVGFGRSGTMSLRSALGVLGFGPCYHMLDVIGEPRRVRQWLAIARGADPDWDEVFAGYRSAVDWPAAAYWRQLAAAYPDAKLVLTTRDPDAWYDSVRNTIFKRRVDPPRGFAGIAGRVVTALSPDLRAFLAMTREIVEQQVFDGRLDDREHAKAVFVRHVEEVQAAFPAERLLTYRVAEGWQPLCRFLGTPVPEQPFPHDNSTADFDRLTAPHLARLVYGPLERLLPGRRRRP